MVDLTVTPGSLHTAASELRGETRRISAALAGLEHEVALLRSGWDGAAREAYERSQQSWSATLGDMRSLLGKIADATDTMAEEYVAADKRAAAYFTR